MVVRQGELWNYLNLFLTPVLQSLPVPAQAEATSQCPEAHMNRIFLLQTATGLWDYRTVTSFGLHQHKMLTWPTERSLILFYEIRNGALQFSASIGCKTSGKEEVNFWFGFTYLKLHWKKKKSSISGSGKQMSPRHCLHLRPTFTLNIM